MRTGHETYSQQVSEGIVRSDRNGEIDYHIGARLTPEGLLVASKVRLEIEHADGSVSKISLPKRLAWMAKDIARAADDRGCSLRINGAWVGDVMPLSNTATLVLGHDKGAKVIF